MGRYIEAADDLLMFINLVKKADFPEMFNLHALRGDALSKAGRYQEAVQEFTDAISLYPYPNYFYHRGVALGALGKEKEAEMDFLRAGTATGPIEWRKKL
jgi:tetratricopeptide (TPR) repeat protein